MKFRASETVVAMIVVADKNAFVGAQAVLACGMASALSRDSLPLVRPQFRPMRTPIRSTSTAS